MAVWKISAECVIPLHFNLKNICHTKLSTLCTLHFALNAYTGGQNIIFTAVNIYECVI